MERYLCDTCLYANNCQFISKHKEGAIGCSAYINTFGVSIDRLREICEAERDGRCVVLPCKVGGNLFVISHTEKWIQEITVSEFSYSVWHDAWVVAAANGHQFFTDNAYRTRAEAEEALKGGTA